MENRGVIVTVLVILASAMFVSMFDQGSMTHRFSATGQPISNLQYVYPAFVFSNDGAFGIYYGICTNAKCNQIPITWTSNSLLRAKLTMGKDNLPLLVHSGSSNILSITKCLDLRCANRISNQIEPPSGQRNEYYDINIGSDGFPIIAYIHQTAQDSYDEDLVLYKCNDVDCTTGVKTIVLNGPYPDTFSGGSFQFNVVVQRNGNPIIVVAQHMQVKVVACGDLTCSQKTVSAIAQSSGVVSERIAVGSDGLPIVAYDNLITGALSFVHCTTPDCSQYSNPIQLTGNGAYATFAILDDGFPAIAYTKWTGPSYFVSYIKCNDLNCNNRVHVNLQNMIGTAHITRGADNLPLIFITEYDPLSNDNQLLTIKCFDDACQNKESNVVYSGGRFYNFHGDR